MHDRRAHSLSPLLAWYHDKGPHGSVSVMYMDLCCSPLGAYGHMAGAQALP